MKDWEAPPFCLSVCLQCISIKDSIELYRINPSPLSVWLKLAEGSGFCLVVSIFLRFKTLANLAAKHV